MAHKQKRSGKPATKSKSPSKAGAKAKPRASKARQVQLLTGGNPQIAKADGDAPAQAYIGAMPGWKRDIGKRLDALIVRNVSNLREIVLTRRWRCASTPDSRFVVRAH